MSTNLPFVGTFILGILIQTALSINLFKDFKKNILIILGTFIFSIFGLMPGKREGGKDYDLGLHLIYSCLIFCVCVAVLFRDKIISTLNEKTLLILNLITLYLIFKSNFSFPIIAMYVCFSIPVVASALMPVRLTDWQEVVFYVWYFILMITIPVAHFRYAEVYNNFIGQNMSYSFSSALSLGMVFCLIVVNLTFLFRFIPFKNKHETYSAAFEHVRQHIKFLENRYKNREQMTFFGASMLIILVGGLLTLNYYINFVADSFLVMFILLFNSFTVRYKTFYS